jgi:hypothetical protein
VLDGFVVGDIFNRRIQVMDLKVEADWDVVCCFVTCLISEEVKLCF